MNIDPFSPDALAPDEQKIYFGEFVVLDGFMGVFVNGLVQYDPELPEHQEYIKNQKAAGKNPPYLAYTYQVWPMGVSWETYPNTVPVFSKEWKLIISSLCKMKGFQLPNDREKLANLMQELRTPGNWFKWELVPTSSYKHRDTGETVQKYGHKLLEHYPDQESCQAAMDAFFNIGGEPDVMEDPEVQKVPKDAAIQFIPALVSDVPNGTEGMDAYIWLEQKIQQMNLDLDINDPDVREAAYQANKEAFQTDAAF